MDSLNKLDIIEKSTTYEVEETTEELVNSAYEIYPVMLRPVIVFTFL